MFCAARAHGHFARCSASDNVGALTGRVTGTLFRTVTGCSPSRYSILTTVLLDATTQQPLVSRDKDTHVLMLRLGRSVAIAV